MNNEPKCPYCDKGFEEGQELWQMFSVTKPPTSLIVTPGQQAPAGAAGQMQLFSKLAHSSCAWVAANPDKMPTASEETGERRVVPE
jgi:hypothetical protein